MPDMLDKLLEGVNVPDSPAGGEGTTAVPEPEGGTPPDSGSPPGEGDKGGGGGGRTADNVYGELTRKMARLEEAVLGHVDASLEKLRQDLRGGQGSIPSNSGDPMAQLEAMSVSQLRGLRGQIPEDKRGEFDKYVTEREISERAESRIQQNEQARQRATVRQDSAVLALTRYPELKNRTSSFALAVGKELVAMGDEANTNPRALLIAANEIALRMEIKPAGVGFPSPRGTPGDTARGGQGGGGSGTAKPVLDPATAETIARTLQHVLPKGKKFDMKRINDRAADYRAARNLTTKG